MAPKRPAELLARPDASSSSSSSSATIQPSSSTRGKRVKFDAATLDATNSGGATTSGATEAELEEDDLLNPSTARKKVVTDGYDSDSSADGSEDGFGGVGGGRKGRKRTGAEKDGQEQAEQEDDDMFDGGADEGEGVAKRNLAEKSTKKEFLEMGDIEGQEFGKGEDEQDGGDEALAEEDEEEEYALEDDLANDDDAPRSRRSKKGMGYQLSSFNMADELNEGRFSADGTYVRNNDDPLATHDKWLDGVSKASIRAARESKKRMDEQARKKEEEEATGAEAMAQQRDDCLIGLLGLVRPGESITMALNRWGKRRRKVAKKVVRPKVRDGDEAMDLDEQPTSSSEVTKGKQREEEEAEAVDPAVKMIDRITYLASTLLAQGELEIYDTSYEAIIRTLKEEGAVRRDWVPPVDPDIAKEEEEERLASLAQPRRGLIARPNVVMARPSTSIPPAVATTVNPIGKKFFYKWKVPQAGQVPNQEYGPFGTEEIETWIQGGFLGPQGANIVVRVDGQGGQAWTSWQEAKV